MRTNLLICKSINTYALTPFTFSFPCHTRTHQRFESWRINWFWYWRASLSRRIVLVICPPRVYWGYRFHYISKWHGSTWLQPARLLELPWECVRETLAHLSRTCHRKHCKPCRKLSLAFAIRFCDWGMHWWRKELLDTLRSMCSHTLRPAWSLQQSVVSVPSSRTCHGCWRNSGHADCDDTRWLYNKLSSRLDSRQLCLLPTPNLIRLRS